MCFILPNQRSLILEDSLHLPILLIVHIVPLIVILNSSSITTRTSPVLAHLTVQIMLFIGAIGFCLVLLQTLGSIILAIPTFSLQSVTTIV